MLILRYLFSHKSCKTLINDRQFKTKHLRFVAPRYTEQKLLHNIQQSRKLHRLETSFISILIGTTRIVLFFFYKMVYAQR